MADERITPSDLRKLILFAAFVYLAITFIGAIAKIILVFSIIALLTVILIPFVIRLERFHIPRAVSALAIALFVLGLTLFVLWLAIPKMATEAWALISEIPAVAARARDWLGQRFPSYAADIPSVSGAELIHEGVSRVLPFLGGLTGYAVNLADVLASGLIIMMSTIYILSSPQAIIQGFLALLPQQQRNKAAEVFTIISCQMRSWALATMIGMLLMFVLTWISLSLLGVKSAFLLAVLTGILEVVPILGPIVSGTLAILVAFGQSPTLAIWTLLVFTGLQQAEGHLILPLIMSGQLKLHPVSVIFSVLVMGALFGLVGVFLATPAAAVAKVLVYELYIHPRQDIAGDELTQKADEMVGGSENHNTRQS